MSSVSKWLQTWWLRVPTPREFSIAYTVAYTIAFVTGVVTLVLPPMTLSEKLGGPTAIMSVGILCIVGAVLGMWGGAVEHWKLERIGLWFMSTALVIYGMIISVLHITQPGSRLTQLGVIGLALVLFFIRWLMIRRFSYRPQG